MTIYIIQYGFGKTYLRRGASVSANSRAERLIAAKLAPAVVKEPLGEQTRSQLTAALTHLVLSGLKQSEVRGLVEDELRKLYAEAT